MPALRRDGNGLLIGGGVILLLAIPLVLVALEYLPPPWPRPWAIRSWLVALGTLAFGLACVVKGLRMRWRARVAEAQLPRGPSAGSGE